MNDRLVKHEFDCLVLGLGLGLQLSVVVTAMNSRIASRGTGKD